MYIWVDDTCWKGQNGTIYWIIINNCFYSVDSSIQCHGVMKTFILVPALLSTEGINVCTVVSC